jgi:stearoyl-CoA desaturase (delta-9 desaturase)
VVENRTRFRSRNWFDAWSGVQAPHVLREGIDWQHMFPLAVLHAGCLGVIWVGWSPFAVGVAFVLHLLRGMFVSGFYHRYFSHRAFRTSRAVQFAFAVLGNSAAQRGPLWWVAHHRNHHRHTDQEEDPHSPRRGLYWSHFGWLTHQKSYYTDMDAVPDLAKFPELCFLDRYPNLVPLLLAVALFATGALLHRLAPGLRTDGPQLLVWGFFISTVMLLNATATVNSIAHRFGTRRFDTNDDSHNNLFVALIACGEGWHNNHHHRPGALRLGLRWWEIDITYAMLRLLSWLRIISLRLPPPGGET